MNPMEAAWMILKNMSVRDIPPAIPPVITPNPRDLTPEQIQQIMSGGPVPEGMEMPQAAPTPPPLDPEFMERIERNRANARQNDQARSMQNAAKREERKRKD